MSRQDQIKEVEQSIPKQQKNVYYQVGGECMKIYQKPDAREAKLFWIKIWGRWKHNRKAESKINVVKELEGLGECPNMK